MHDAFNLNELLWKLTNKEKFHFFKALSLNLLYLSFLVSIVLRTWCYYTNKSQELRNKIFSTNTRLSY